MIPDEPIDPSAARLAAAKEAAIRSLATNPTFRECWLEGYMVEDIENKLQQLRTAAVEDLAVARQRWLDAEAAYNQLKADIHHILNTPPHPTA